MGKRLEIIGRMKLKVGMMEISNSWRAMMITNTSESAIYYKIMPKISSILISSHPKQPE